MTDGDSLLPPITVLAPGQAATAAAVHRALDEACMRGYSPSARLAVVVPTGCMHGLLRGVTTMHGAEVCESGYLQPGEAYVVQASLLDEIPQLVEADRERRAREGLVPRGQG